MKKAILLLPLFFLSKFFSQFNTVTYRNSANNIRILPITENHFGNTFLSYHIERKSHKKDRETNVQQKELSELEKDIGKAETKVEPALRSDYTDLEEDLPAEEIEEIPDKKIYFRKLKLISESNYDFAEKQIVFMPLRHMVITSNFGNRFHPVDKVNKFHAGVDLRANGEYVYAVLDGIVSESGYNGGAGNYIKIRHRDFETAYLHLFRTFYSEGDIIYAGDIIALSGNTGKSTAPHLHFAVKENGRYINPIQFLNDLIQTNNALADYNNGK